MKSYWKIIIIIFLLFPLSLIVIAFNKWDVINSNFFSYSISDIINLVCTGYIGVVVMVTFSTMASNSMKRLEIISENLTMLQSYSENILNIFSNNLNASINDNSKGHIIRSLRIASNEFANIRDFLLTEKMDKSIIALMELAGENLINFKQATTDKPFQRNYKIKEIDIQNATDSHNKLKQHTQQIKLKLYK
jgi:uncharacterized membrane protein